MPNHNAAVPSPELIDKEVKVLELRRAGLTWQRIAEETGYADHTGAYAAYKRALKRTLKEPADDIRKMETERLDRLQLALWPKALEGDYQAINSIMKIMDRRSRLLGLDAPATIKQEVTTWSGDGEIDAAIRSLTEALTLRDADSGGSDTMDKYRSESESTSSE